MQLDFAPRFDRLIDRERRARREGAGYQYTPGPDAGAITCVTHPELPEPQRHKYTLRPQPGNGMTCTCGDYSRAPKGDDGLRDPCKHICEWWRRNR